MSSSNMLDLFVESTSQAKNMMSNEPRLRSRIQQDIESRGPCLDVVSWKTSCLELNGSLPCRIELLNHCMVTVSCSRIGL